MSIRSTLMAFLLLFTIAILSESCEKKCKSCDYATACKNGYCFCQNGFEGDSCKTYSFTKFVGDYIASDPCSQYGNGYNVHISSFNDPSRPGKIYLSNLFGVGAEADILSDASKQGVNLNIPDNQGQGAIGFSGSGLYQIIGGRARITLNISYVQGGVSSDCTVILNQQ